MERKVRAHTGKRLKPLETATKEELRMGTWMANDMLLGDPPNHVASAISGHHI